MSKPINISASRGAAILGLSKWKTQAHAVLEIIEELNPGFCKKNKYELPEFDQDAAVLRWGSAFESAIIELAEQKQDYKITDREGLFEKDFLSCHIDGAYLTNGNIFHDELHEGKTTSIFNFNDNYGEPGTDQVPIENQIQCQHQMICTGAGKVILSVLVFPKRVDDFEEMGTVPWELKVDGISKGWQIDFSKDGIPFKSINPIEWAHALDNMGYFHQYEIKANPELQKIMIEHYTEIWYNNIMPCIPIKPTTYDDVKMLVREPFGTIVADEEMERMVNVYKNIKSEISTTGDLAKQANLLKVKILKYMKKNAGENIDEDSEIKFILRDRSGNKLASYGKDKNGKLIFR